MIWARIIFGGSIILAGILMFFFPQTKDAAWFPLSFGVGYTASVLG